MPPLTEAWIPQAPPTGIAANCDQTIGLALMFCVTKMPEVLMNATSSVPNCASRWPHVNPGRLPAGYVLISEFPL